MSSDTQVPPPPPPHPALLVIDLQRWFLEVGSPAKLARVESLIARTNDLIDLFHDHALPVVHIQTIHDRAGTTWNQWMKQHHSPRLVEGTREAERHPAVRAAASDLVVTKTRHSAFIRTDLEPLLRQRGVDTLVLAGFATNACVGLTAIEAWERDFAVILAGDAILGTEPAEGDLMLDYLRNRFEIVPATNPQIRARLATCA